jgi:hypothetical protein
MATYPNPPHGVQDGDKLAAMVEALREGRPLPPIVSEPGGYNAICGSHRIAAWRAAEAEPDVLVMSEADWSAACTELGVDYLDEVDYEDQCRAVAGVTTDPEIRAALADQV